MCIGNQRILTASFNITSQICELSKFHYFNYIMCCKIEVESFVNYSTDAEAPVRLELPDQWLWDIIDEFIYQVSSYAFYSIVHDL